MKCSWWICLLLFAAMSASALEVQQAKWGFDGLAVPGRFNLLSVLVANSSTEPFDGTVTFYKSRGLNDRAGALYAAPCYVSPLTARWVQFYVYIDNQYDQWRLEWGRGPDDRHDLEPPKWGPPAQVILADSEIVSAISVFRQFPDELFPPTPAATSGLDTLLLDHVPRWEPAKRQALLSWLRAGGKLHVLLGPDGRYPIFSDELSLLNSIDEQTRIGAGFVVRHAVTAAQIRKQDIGESEGPKKTKPEDSNAVYQTTNSLLAALARLSHARLSWGLIYLMAFVYLALVGPVNLVAGRRFADYRLRITLLIATVAVFTWLFNLVGRRGQGEASVVHTLSYARAIDGNDYDVMQWINVFATHGGHYTITHTAPHNIYSSGQDYEAVNGFIESGKNGKFAVDIPMFSRRGFLHEAEMKGADMGVKIVNWDGTNALKKLTLAAQPDFTKQILEGWLVQGDQVYAMKLTNGQIQFEDAGKQSLSASLTSSDPRPAMFVADDDDAADPDVEKEFRKLAKPLIAWSLGVAGPKDAETAHRAADGRVQLFLFAHSPESFSITGPHFGREIGYVLYRLDLFKPGS
jgi:hypothetical protein